MRSFRVVKPLVGISCCTKQFGIFAEPSPHPMAGKEMEHTATVLLFDASGSFVTTISPHEPDSDALAALQKLVA